MRQTLKVIRTVSRHRKIYLVGHSMVFAHVVFHPSSSICISSHSYSVVILRH